MSFLWYVLWFIVAVGLLVTVHEFGHFWVARRLGFKVLRFSVGFGKPLFKKTAGRDQTEYVVAALPLGGYVKMLDEREGPVPAHELHRSFTRRPHWQRITVLLAGPGFNTIFAILVLWGMFWVSGVTHIRPVVGEVRPDSAAARAGLQQGDRILSINGAQAVDQRDVVFGLLDAMSTGGEATLRVRGEDNRERNAVVSVASPDERKRLTEVPLLMSGLGFRFQEPPIAPVLGKVIAGGPAAQAGLQEGDRILAINDAPMADFRDLVERVSASAGETLNVRFRRGGSEATARVNVASDEVQGRKIGRIRVAPPAGIKYPPEMIEHRALGPVAALGRAGQEAWDLTVLQARFFWRMITGNASLKNLSGPLSIAEFAGDSAQAGAASFLGFLVLISLSLAFLNLLPIPILDGGQIMFQAIEWAKGSPLSERAQVLGQQVGIALLILLMGVALFNDIARQFG